jgi:predicted HAD superfamily Cof-like phosphohydrolase
MSLDWYQDVRDFHEKFDCYRQDRPGVPARGTVGLRWGLIDEEVNRELRPAMDAGNLEDIADAIVDAIYVLNGTAVSYGIDLRPIWDAVHQANMAKTDGGKRADGKILKPPGWVAPDVAGIIEEQRKRGMGYGSQTQD